MRDLYDLFIAGKLIGGGTISIDSWYNIRQIVDQGLAKKYFKVGDQLACMRGSERIVWDVVNVMPFAITLLYNSVTVYSPFSNKQAAFTFSEGLAAGTYCYIVDAQPSFPADAGKTIQFTTSQSIPAGGQIVLNNSAAKSMIGATASSYAGAASLSAIETFELSEGGLGTLLGHIDVEGDFENGINSISRAMIGSNRYADGSRRQIVNSDKPAGSVWSPKSKFDRPPSWVNSTNGFAYGLDEDFLSVVSPSTFKVARSIVDGGGYDVCTDKFFLPSESEIYGSSDPSPEEGRQYQYYMDSTVADKIKYRSGYSYGWSLRTIDANSPERIEFVSSNGVLAKASANTNVGYSPACRIAKEGH